MDDRFNPNDNGENKPETSDSLYSYNYRGESQNSATHEGDYNAKRDDVTQQNSQNAGSTYNQSASTGNAYGQDFANSQSNGSTYNQNTSSDGVYGQTNTYYSNAQGGTSQNNSYGNNAYSGNAQSGAQNYSYQQQNGSQANGAFSQDTSYQSSYANQGSTGKKPQANRKARRAAKAGHANNNWFRKKGFGQTLVKGVVIAAVVGVVAGGTFYGVSGIGRQTTPQTSLAATKTSTSTDKTAISTATTVTDVSDIVKNVMPSIVSITTVSQTEYYNMFNQSQTYQSEGAGSGIIVAEDDDNLYIATNNHVVENSTSLTVCFSDDETVSGTVKGTDSSADLAVVSVKKSDMKSDTLSTIKIATLGDSDELSVGESSVAIGNALGYGQSVTTGVISALNRQVSTTDETSGTTVTNNLIQTDAAINPGNSGGALLNMKGEVIGINSVKYSDTSVEGMGYAIPISTAKPIIDDLISREKVDSSKSAYLGISGADVSSQVAKTYNMPEGVYVAQVEQGSAAESAGLQKGDIITEFDGHQITSMENLKERLQYYEAGKKVTVKIQRADNGGYKEQSIEVTLGSKSN